MVCFYCFNASDRRQIRKTVKFAKHNKKLRLTYKLNTVKPKVDVYEICPFHCIKSK